MSCPISSQRARMQRRLLAQQATTGKNLQRQIMKAKDQHEEMEAQVAAAATDADIHQLRGAFIVFNEARLADDAISSAPRGTALDEHVPLPPAANVHGGACVSVTQSPYFGPCRLGALAAAAWSMVHQRELDILQCRAASCVWGSNQM